MRYLCGLAQHALHDPTDGDTAIRAKRKQSRRRQMPPGRIGNSPQDGKFQAICQSDARNGRRLKIDRGGPSRRIKRHLGLRRHSDLPATDHGADSHTAEHLSELIVTRKNRAVPIQYSSRDEKIPRRKAWIQSARQAETDDRRNPLVLHKRLRGVKRALRCSATNNDPYPHIAQEAGFRGEPRHECQHDVERVLSAG